jgi:16S rRNA (adenine1518-N6/adenine1519-N6)-dimethyltransferase
MPKPKKSLGQNWLKDRNILLEIAQLSAGTAKTVLEIGPGLGTLTSALLKHFDQVIAIEFDKNLATNLPKSFPGKNLEVIHADILDYDLTKLPKNYAVAGNIPYYITSPIIQKFLHAKNLPNKITLLVQKEVAECLAATEGKYSILGLSAQIYAKVSLGPVVKRDQFSPPPKVDSQIIILEPRQKPLATEKTMALIKLGFSSPRKKLATNLSVTLQLPRESIHAIFDKINLTENVRPADLSIDDWIKLETFLHKR